MHRCVFLFQNCIIVQVIFHNWIIYFINIICYYFICFQLTLYSDSIMLNQPLTKKRSNHIYHVLFFYSYEIYLLQHKYKEIVPLNVSNEIRSWHLVELFCYFLQFCLQWWVGNVCFCVLLANKKCIYWLMLCVCMCVSWFLQVKWIFFLVWKVTFIHTHTK